MKIRQNLINVAAVLSVVFVLAATFFLESAEKKKLQQEKRSLVLNHLSTKRASLESSINATLFLTRGLVAHIAIHPDISAQEFQNLARELISTSSYIRNIGLAKDNVISHIYPIEGNEAAVGLRYLDHPDQRAAVLRVLESRKTVIAGPVKLVQGGIAFISRTPVFLALPEGEPEGGDYWGIVSMVINMDFLFKKAGLSGNISSGLIFAVRGKDGLGKDGDIFFGDEQVFKADPLVLDINLPEGSWQIAAVPVEGWKVPWYHIVEIRFAGFIIAVMLGTLIWMFGRLSEAIVQRKIEEAEAESDRAVKTLAESLPEVVYRADSQTFDVLYVNKAIENIYGYSVKKWFDNPHLWEESIYPDDKRRVIERINEAREKHLDGTFEYRIVKKDGSVRWVEDRISWAYDDNGDISALNGLVFDITGRKEAEERLLLLVTAIERSNVGITIADLNGRILYSNPADAAMHGYEVEELIGRDVTVFAPEESRNTLSVETMAKTKRRESVNLKKDGSTFPVYLISDLVNDANGNPVGLVTVCEDISERKKVENELKTSRQQLRNFTASLQSAREEERKNIAREVHDELGQSLTALKIDLSILSKNLPENKVLGERIRLMRDVINSSLQSVKRISKELRTDVLDELGLETAIEGYIKEFASRSAILCEAKIEPVCKNMASEVCLVIYRVFQEAMTNILRHARAERVKIKLQRKGNSLSLVVSDNGLGIEKSKVSDLMSIGLIGMMERMNSIDGTFKIRGISGVGTTVQAVFCGKAKLK